MDSNNTDLHRGVYQCIKYRAVMEAMDTRSEPHVVPILVIQTNIPSYLKELARRHGIHHFVAPKNLL